MSAMLLRCAAFTLVLSATAAAADSGNGASFPVQAGIVLESGEPIVGKATCTVGRDCSIFATERHKIGLSLKVARSSPGCPFKELSLTCEDGDCSFDNGRPSLKFGSERQFDFYAGSNFVEIPLVLQTRVKIGRVFLIFPDIDRDCGTIVSPIGGWKRI